MFLNKTPRIGKNFNRPFSPTHFISVTLLMRNIYILYPTRDPMGGVGYLLKLPVGKADD